MFAHSVRVDANFVIAAPDAHLHLASECRATTFACGGVGDVASFLAQRPEPFQRVLVLPRECNLADALGILPAPVSQLDLRRRIPPGSLVQDNPQASRIATWRQQMGIGRGRPRAAPSAEEEDLHRKVLMALPTTGARTSRVEPIAHARGPHRLQSNVDPVKIIRALGFARFLRRTEFFKPALQAAAAYEASDSDYDVQRGPKAGEGKATLDARKQRLDSTGMLLQRRLFAADMATDNIVAVNIQSDGSPVTGTEFQGMIVEFVLRSGGVRQCVLPGSTLNYGHAGSVMKTVALLWGCWLVCGPSLDSLVYLCSKVRGITTDGGIEMHTLETPDFTKAFLAWVSGQSLHECARLIDFSRRLFPHALRVIGWSHTCGGIMKYLVKQVPQWPSVLDELRCVCRAYRNKTWRAHIARAAKGRVPHSEKLLESFTATFAKWRYETLDNCFRSILPLREISESVIKIELFMETQEKELIKSFVLACEDKPLWRLVQALYTYIVHPVETLRRWGMVCGHEKCEELRKAHKKVECDQNSRRLRDAWTEVQNTIGDAKQLANVLTNNETEGHDKTCELIRTLLLSAAGILRTRFKYLGVIPWAFARADTQQGAIDVLDQYAKVVDPSKHDDFTTYFMLNCMDDLKTLATTGVCSARLAAEVKAINWLMLDEGAGEGYHRSTNAELTRATGSSTAHLKQTPRHDMCLKLAQDFCRTPEGRMVVRHDWRTHTRVLQTDPSHLWRPTRWKPKAFYRRLYREDEKALEDWSSILQRMPNAHEVSVPTTSEREKLEQEWFTRTLKPHAHYSVSSNAPDTATAGQPQPAPRETCFLLLSMVHGTSKPHLMLTVEDADNVEIVAPVALQVQFLDTSELAQDVPEQSRVVFFSRATQSG